MIKIYKKFSFLPLFMVVVMLSSSIPFRAVAYAAGDFQKIIMKINDENITVDGTSRKLDPSNPGTTPIIMEGKTMLPVSCLGDLIGVKTDWDASTNKVTITADSKKIVLTIGNKQISVDGKTQSIDVAPVIVNGRTMLPISAITGLLGLSISWDGKTAEVTITKSGTATAAATIDTVTLTDQAGRQVTFKSNPKVASCYYISTLISLVLGGSDNLVGLENKNARQPIYSAFGSDLLGLPEVGSGKGVNFEQLATTGAEVIIIPKRLQESIPQLEQIGVQAVVVVPETLDGLMECFEILGKVYGQEARATEIVTFYKTKLNEISELTKNSSKPKVYVAGNSSFLNAGTGSMYQNTIVELAGGVNVAADLKANNWDQISVEQLQVYAPEIILIANGAEYKPEDLYNNAQLKGIPAIDNKKVYVFPSSMEAWDTPSASSMLGIMWAANKINPSVYTESKMSQEVVNFYKEFYKTTTTYKEVIKGK